MSFVLLVHYLQSHYLKDSIQGDISVAVLFVLCFGVDVLCYLNLMYVFMYVFIVLVKFR